MALRPTLSPVERDEMQCQANMTIRGERLRAAYQPALRFTHLHFQHDYAEDVNMPVFRDPLDTRRTKRRPRGHA